VSSDPKNELAASPASQVQAEIRYGSEPLSKRWAPISSGNTFAVYLQHYFRSGWAFLIPYLAAYLLYAWLKWPVNPASADSQPSTGFRPPCLLHVYWSLHTIHLLLGTIALRSWWKTAALKLQLSTSTGAPSARPPSTTHRSLETVYRLLPWAFLGLLFCIPGIYLEWPSDPWEHLHRINEWHALDEVTAHSAWEKSSYFLTYSLTQHATGLAQVDWLNIYYTAVCLLLSWQYYRLARAVGLSERASFIFVLLSVLTFGNNIFSFYRYYGISSSIYAQLGAVAITRIAVDFRQRKESTEKERLAGSSFYILNFWGPLGAVLLLATFTAFSHVQGLVIAGLGFASLIIWQMIEWKRSAAFWLMIGIIGLNAACIAWWPKHPLIPSLYIPAGWLNSWYGFNIFVWPSPAADRLMHVLGISGMINLVAGFMVLRRNQVIGWLTLGPVIGLSLPCVAIAFVDVIAPNNPGEIAAFPRLLFAIPAGLALVSLTQKGGALAKTLESLNDFVTRLAGVRLGPQTGYILLILCLVGAATLPMAAPYSNRVWHLLSRTPDDLALHPIWKGTASLRSDHGTPAEPRVITMSQPGFILDLQQTGYAFVAYRHYARSARSPIDDLIALAEFIGDPNTKHATHVLLFDQGIFFSPSSIAAFYSAHWPAQETVLATAGTPELKPLIAQAGLQQQTNPTGLLFLAEKKKETQNANDEP